MFWLFVLLVAVMIAWLVVLWLIGTDTRTLLILSIVVIAVSILGWWIVRSSDTANIEGSSTPGVNTINFINTTPVDLLLGTTENIKNDWLIPAGGELTLSLSDNKPGQLGRRFWARAGCRYDRRYGKAQCLVGDCGQRYDCDGLSGQAPVSLAEFCLGCDNNLTYYDVSLVDGYSLSIDIEPLDIMPPPAPDPHWNITGLCRADRDLRETCPSSFQLLASERSGYIDGPDYVLACFSNCGRYEYPNTPSPDCDPATDERCAHWRKYCCTSQSNNRSCSNSSSCDDGTTCWTEPGRSQCACRGWTKADCPTDVCTFQSLDAQPPLGRCSPGDSSCIGDDTLHEVCPYAYTWPNDPQTHTSNSRNWRVTFAAKAPLPPSIDSFPSCSSLPSRYSYATAVRDCGQRSGLAGAKTQGSWDCDVTDIDKATNGTVCQW